jgi:hypothetical protein
VAPHKLEDYEHHVKWLAVTEPFPFGLEQVCFPWAEEALAELERLPVSILNAPIGGCVSAGIGWRVCVRMCRVFVGMECGHVSDGVV